jgi:carbonic anhydrase/acetyltransferase-like protein (isoleucine patch superfamily)
LIGSDSIISHWAVVLGCEIGGRCLLGPGAKMLEGSSLKTGCALEMSTVLRSPLETAPGSIIGGEPPKAKGTAKDPGAALLKQREELKARYKEYGVYFALEDGV